MTPAPIPAFQKRNPNTPIKKYMKPQVLAERAENVWREAGYHNVIFWAEPYTGNIRSNLVNGLPPKRST